MSVKVTGLAKHYGEVAVFQNVSLDVAAGEFVAIVGESGVGKSTLLNCMAGLDDWDAGSVALDGVDLSTLGADGRALLRRSKVGFVFQAFHVLPHLDVAQNVGLPLMLLQRPDDARVQAMLDAVGLQAWGRGCRRRSAAASCSAWRLHVRWCTALRCCWPTSPPATSTPPPPPP